MNPKNCWKLHESHLACWLGDQIKRSLWRFFTPDHPMDASSSSWIDSGKLETRGLPGFNPYISGKYMEVGGIGVPVRMLVAIGNSGCQSVDLRCWQCKRKGPIVLSMFSPMASRRASLEQQINALKKDVVFPGGTKWKVLQAMPWAAGSCKKKYEKHLSKFICSSLCRLIFWKPLKAFMHWAVKCNDHHLGCYFFRGLGMPT